MPDSVMVVLLTIVLNFGVWGIQRLVNRRVVFIERRKANASAIQEENDTLEDILKNYKELSESYVAQNITLRQLTEKTDKNEQKIVNMEKKIQTISEENVALKNESAEQRKMIEFEKNQSQILRDGIHILIAQIKAVPLTPKWEPKD